MGSLTATRILSALSVLAFLAGWHLVALFLGGACILTWATAPDDTPRADAWRRNHGRGAYRR